MSFREQSSGERPGLVRALDRRARNRRVWRRRRGVSDVIATILLLGMTVALFSAIFLFVNKFPKPLPQGTDQFQASLVLDPSSSGSIYGVKITLGAGPTVATTAAVYLVPSKAVAGNWQFGRAAGIPIRWGLNSTPNSSANPWVSGQVWFSKFKVEPTLPNNITVDVVAQSILLFQVVLTGGTVNSPPVISQVWTNKTTPQVGQSFTINALLTGNLKGATATIYLGGIPTLTKTAQPFVINTGTGLGSYNVLAGGTTASGSFLAFIQGNNSAGQTFSASVPVTIVPVTTGTNPTVGVTVSVSPSPVVDRTNESLYATITNAGLGTVTPTSVTFYINFTNNATWTHPAKFVVSSGLPSISSGQSAVVSASTFWMPGPNVTQNLGQVNVTVVVVYGVTPNPVGSRNLYVAPAPFKVKVNAPSLIGTPPGTVLSYWTIPVTVTNTGSLGNCIVNITVYVNQTGGTTPKGTVYYPSPVYGVSGTGVGFATPAANATFTILPSGATLVGTVIFQGPGGSAISLTVTAFVTVYNALWNGMSPTLLKLKASLTFTD